MQTIYIGNTLINDIYLGNKRMEDSLQVPSSLLGTFYNGGYVYYQDTSLRKVLIFASGSQVGNTYSWGCSGTDVTTTSALFQGNTNTTNILAACPTRPIGASYADGFSLNGYSDWYLPSENELIELAKANAVIPNSWGLVNNGVSGYMSSTQVSSTNARFILMNSAGSGFSRSKATSSVGDVQYVVTIRQDTY